MISKDPYKILGVSPTASDAEIKSAYKELVKKYHPDQYQDNPLADVAEEKMSEIKRRLRSDHDFKTWGRIPVRRKRL